MANLLDRLHVSQVEEQTIECVIKSINKWTNGNRDDQYIMKFTVGDGDDAKTVTAFVFENVLGEVPKIPFGGLKAEIDLREAIVGENEYANVVGVRLDYENVGQKTIAALCGKSFNLA